MCSRRIQQIKRTAWNLWNWTILLDLITSVYLEGLWRTGVFWPAPAVQTGLSHIVKSHSEDISTHFSYFLPQILMLAAGHCFRRQSTVKVSVRIRHLHIRCRETTRQNKSKILLRHLYHCSAPIWQAWQSLTIHLISNLYIIMYIIHSVPNL